MCLGEFHVHLVAFLGEFHVHQGVIGCVLDVGHLSMNG